MLTYVIMYLKFQEDFGRFNFADPTEEKTNFYLDILDDDGKPVEVDGVRCRLNWSEEDDQRGRWGFSDDFTAMATESWKNAKKWIGSTDYKRQTLNFVSVFNQNREEIERNHEQRRKERIEKEIAHLQEELSRPELASEPISSSAMLAEEIDRLNKWIASSEKELGELKEGGERYTRELARIEGYKAELAGLVAIISAESDGLQEN